MKTCEIIWYFLSCNTTTKKPKFKSQNDYKRDAGQPWRPSYYKK